MGNGTTANRKRGRGPRSAGEMSDDCSLCCLAKAASPPLISTTPAVCSCALLLAMPPASPFADPRKRTPRSQSLRSSLHRQNRKRKRDSDDKGDAHEAEASDDESFAAGTDAASTRPTSSAITTLSAAKARQFRVAGHDPDRPLPSPPFPHAPATSRSEKKLTPSQLQRELASLKPPLYVPTLPSAARLPQSSSHEGNHLRKHVIQQTMEVLHYCLLRGDYQRAGRAWKLIMSLGRGSTKIDERAHSRWGIAAELHLHAKPSVDDASGAQPSKVDDAMFSEEGFKAARMYYERLILEHPYQQSHPRATSALTFYPAMFSLWIYEVSQASRTALAAAENTDSPENEGGSEDVSDSEDSPNRHVSRREARILAARTDELRRAREIAARLDDLLSSPHYDKRPDLLHLRGMIAVWVGDLVTQVHQSERIIDGETVSEEVSERDDAERAEQLSKAKDLFQRAKAHGGRLSEGATQILDAVDD